jgi:DNA replication licensing factor MCM5
MLTLTTSFLLLVVLSPHKLLGRWRKKETFLEVDFAHLNEYDPELLELVTSKPIENLPLFEEAIREALQQLIVDKPDGDDMDGLAATSSGSNLPDFQLLAKSEQVPSMLRHVNADHVNKLIKVPGIIISASRLQSKAVTIECRCTKCGTRKVISCTSGFAGAVIPTLCDMGGNLPVDGATQNCGPNS